MEDGGRKELQAITKAQEKHKHLTHFDIFLPFNAYSKKPTLLLFLRTPKAAGKQGCTMEWCPERAATGLSTGPCNFSLLWYILYGTHTIHNTTFFTSHR